LLCIDSGANQMCRSRYSRGSPANDQDPPVLFGHTFSRDSAKDMNRKRVTRSRARCLGAPLPITQTFSPRTRVPHSRVAPGSADTGDRRSRGTLPARPSRGKRGGNSGTICGRASLSHAAICASFPYANRSQQPPAPAEPSNKAWIANAVTLASRRTSSRDT
jgi:hypothetical protein